MLCEKCKKKKAVVFYSENMSGKVCSYSLCTECAAQLKKNGEPEDISSVLSQWGNPYGKSAASFDNLPLLLPKTHGIVPESTCPSCGLTLSEITSKGTVGCSGCYTFFETALAPALKAIHGSSIHIGNSPFRQRDRRERLAKAAKLREEQKKAVLAEDFETAATLRDRIKSLESDLQ